MGRHSQPLLQEQAYQHEACGSYLWFPCLRILGSPGCRLWSPSCSCGCRGPYSACPPCSFSSPCTCSPHSPRPCSPHSPRPCSPYSPRPCSPHSPCSFCSSSTPSCQARPCTNCTPRAGSPPSGPCPSGPPCCSPSSALRPSSFQPVPRPGRVRTVQLRSPGHQLCQGGLKGRLWKCSRQLPVCRC